MSKEKKIFWSKLAAYVLIGLIIPAGFLIYRFNLFSQTTKMNIGGWGVVAIVFTAVFIAVLAKQASEAVESELARKAIDSSRKVLVPLLAATLCIYAVGEFWKQLLQFFIVLTICEPIAYVINPLPEIAKENKDKEEKNKLLGIFNLFWSSKK